MIPKCFQMVPKLCKSGFASLRMPGCGWPSASEPGYADESFSVNFIGSSQALVVGESQWTCSRPSLFFLLTPLSSHVFRSLPELYVKGRVTFRREEPKKVYAKLYVWERADQAEPSSAWTHSV